MPDGRAALAAVVIGRNEGERLVRCLQSVLPRVEELVYVDSGSSDGSVERARALGARVVELDTRIPFTAGRARNAGFEALREGVPGPALVQFVDGDCELCDGWLEAARDALEHHDDVAVVCGRRRERTPDASPYNRLCDIEWDTPIGEALACGGDFLVRAAAFEKAGGFEPDVIAGEEPELCLRLRRAGWRILRIDRDMTLHDAAMSRMGQWARRSQRAGHAFAELAWRHGRASAGIGWRPALSAVGWGLALPLAVLLSALSWGAAWLLALPVAWVALFLRVRRNAQRRGLPGRIAALYARFIVLGKFAQTAGVLRFLSNRLRRRRSTLIEYKGAGT